MIMWIEHKILDVQEEIESEHKDITLLASHRRRIANSIKQELLKRIGEKKEFISCGHLIDNKEDYETYGYNEMYDKVVKVLESGE